MAEVRWHINENGVAGRCKAQPGDCPIAPNAPHFETAADARAAYEESMEASAVAAPAQRATKPMSTQDSNRRKDDRRATVPSYAGSGHGHGSSLSHHGASTAPIVPERRINLQPVYGHGGHGL